MVASSSHLINDDRRPLLSTVGQMLSVPVTLLFDACCSSAQMLMMSYSPKAREKRVSSAAERHSLCERVVFSRAMLNFPLTTFFDDAVHCGLPAILMTPVKTAWAALTLVGWLTAVTARNQIAFNSPAEIKPLKKWDWLRTSYHGALQQQADGHNDIQGRASHPYGRMNAIANALRCSSHARLQRRQLALA